MLKESAKFGFAHAIGFEETRNLYFESIQVNIMMSSIENLLVEYLENGKWEWKKLNILRLFLERTFKQSNETKVDFVMS